MGFSPARRRLTSLLTGLAAAFLANAAFAACDQYEFQIRGDWGVAAFSVEVADTPEERAQGLMHRTDLPKSSGMIFVYDRPQRVSFWMRNTPLPLDLLFFGESGRLERIHREAIPFDETSIPGGDDILVVLEINGGLSDVFGFAVGDAAQHPAFDRETALWPCPVD